MVKKISHLFWDSCCFIAFLENNTKAYDVASLEQYLDEAKNGQVVIYTSTIALAEVRPSFLKKKSIGSFADFVSDLNGAVSLIEPSPNIMILAGQLRDFPYKKANTTSRQLGTPDAIMLASCIYLRDTLGVEIDHFHTYDEGKKRGLEGGKGIPIIGYQEWCEGFAEVAPAAQVVSLSRTQPIHPQPLFPLVAKK
jgi:predicted nucleic acid-binding protein